MASCLSNSSPWRPSPISSTKDSNLDAGRDESEPSVSARMALKTSIAFLPGDVLRSSSMSLPISEISSFVLDFDSSALSGVVLCGTPASVSSFLSFSASGGLSPNRGLAIPGAILDEPNGVLLPNAPKGLVFVAPEVALPLGLNDAAKPVLLKPKVGFVPEPNTGADPDPYTGAGAAEGVSFGFSS